MYYYWQEKPSGNLDFYHDYLKENTWEILMYRTFTYTEQDNLLSHYDQCEIDLSSLRFICLTLCITTPL